MALDTMDTDHYFRSLVATFDHDARDSESPDRRQSSSLSAAFSERA